MLHNNQKKNAIILISEEVKYLKAVNPKWSKFSY
jgi:hypothetical protein